ncbi:hypothetical protein BESB_080230 [Besnoitia besnoiti]|uniref:Exportin-1/Importin-beta-like domain-containing protein n=1 Tax=Besnoitia besnoiti TaxID=94643 RepID=A0A2A9MDV4_BESBE|nr:hypothetical protein BESB_080230 [Besnoitia besnoiti]PFH33807.1 hypothetical protein BESB_080230 [Besnoitia besnoiti]
MAEEEDSACGQGAASPAPLPVLNEEALALLQRRLEQELHVLFFDPHPEAKTAANTWLLQFQESPEAWGVARHILAQHLLPSTSGSSSANEQLVMVAAQTLAWKVVHQPQHLRLEEKKQLACGLLQLVASLQQQAACESPSDLQLSAAALSRLSECIANCIIQTAAAASVWPSALSDVLQFARLSARGAADASAAQPPCLFSLTCYTAVCVLGALPGVLKGLDAPSRGVRRIVETPQALSCEKQWKAVIGLVADVLLAAAQTASSSSSVPSPSQASPPFPLPPCCVAGPHGACARYRARAVEGVLHLLVAWIGLWDVPFLQHDGLCRALASVTPLLANESALTDCLVAALPKLSTYMQLWSLSGPPQSQQQAPRSSSCSSRSRVLCDGPGGREDTPSPMGGGAAASGAGDAAQQQLLRAWGEGSLPSAGGEGELCVAVVTQLVEFSKLLKAKENGAAGAAARPDEDEGEESALLLRWGAVLQTLVEGYPGLLLEDFGAAVVVEAVAGGDYSRGGGGGGQSVCGELLVQLWRRQPQTWLSASNVWGVIKELRRDQLLPLPVLRLLLQRLAPPCITSMLQHCRRDSRAWATLPGEPLSAETIEERRLFIETAGDAVCDVFFLYDACGVEEGREFLQSLSQSMQTALQRRDAAGAEVLLLLSDALVEGLNGIPLPLAPLFLCLPVLPDDDPCCAAAAAKILKKAAIHFTEEDPEYEGLNVPPTATCTAALLTQIWTVALQTLLRLLPLDPPLVADSILQLTTWGGHHLGGCGGAETPDRAANPPAGLPGGHGAGRGGVDGGEAAAGAAARGGAGGRAGASEGGPAALQELELFCKFVEETGPRHSVQVDGTLHAAAVKLVLTFPRQDIPRLFNSSMRGARQLLQRCCAGLEAATAAGDAATAARAMAAWREDASRALQKLELCCSALCGGRVCTSRNGSASGVGGGGFAGGGACAGEDDGQVACAALECFLMEDDLWMLWLQVIRGALLLQPSSWPASMGLSSAGLPATLFSPLNLPVNSVTRQRVHLCTLIVDLKGKEPLEPPQSNEAVLAVLALRCMRLLLRGLASSLVAAGRVWPAVAELVGSELVSSAATLTSRVTDFARPGSACAADAAANAARPSWLCAQAALQACGVVVLGDLLRLAKEGSPGEGRGGAPSAKAGGGGSQERPDLLQAVKSWAAQRLRAITALFFDLGRLLTSQQGLFDLYAPFLDFLLAYAAAAPGVQALTGSASKGALGCVGIREFRRGTGGGSQGGGEPADAGAGSELQTRTGELLGPNDLFCQVDVFETTLQLCVEAVRQSHDADVARQAILYCHACSTCGAAQVDRIVAKHLPGIVAATLENLHCWGLENLSVLWKAFALWTERYDQVFLATVSEWLTSDASAACAAGAAPGRTPAPTPSRLRDMEFAQKEIVFCCFRSFRGARMRQLLQDLCLIASGSIVPSDALVAYEYALQSDQYKSRRSGSGVAQNQNPACLVEIS